MTDQYEQKPVTAASSSLVVTARDSLRTETSSLNQPRPSPVLYAVNALTFLVAPVVGVA